MEKHLVPLFGVIKGKIKEGAWSRGFRFVPATPEESDLKGNLLVCLELSSSDPVDLDQLGARLVGSLQESYYAGSTTSTLESLKGALSQFQLKLKELLPALKISNLEVSGSVVVVWGQVLYLGKIESGSVVLKRDNFFGPIQFNKIASGRLHSGDWLVLANDGFWTELSKETLSPLLDNRDFEGSLQRIDQLVGEKENVACVVANLQVEEGLEDSDQLVLVETKDKVPGEKTKALFVYVGQKFTFFLKKLIAAVRAVLFILLPRLFKELKNQVQHLKGPKIRGVKSNRRRFILIGVILVLGVVLLFNLYLKGVKDKQAKAATLITQASQKLDEAKNLQTLNPTRAKSLLGEVVGSLNQAKTLNPKVAGLVGLTKTSQDLLAALRREYRIAELPLFYDLGFLKGNKVVALASGGTGLYVVDDNGNLVLLDLKEKQSSVLATEPRLKTAKKILVATDRLLIDTGNSLVQFDLTNKKFLDDMSLPVGTKDISFYNDNLYVLTASSLLKAPLVKTGSFNFVSYVTGNGVDLSSAQGLVVGGFVWVVTDGTLLQFSRGERQDLSISGLANPWKSSQDIYSSETTKYVYILDKENSRVVVIDKTGSYYSQYISPQIGEITAIVADETKGKLYLAGKEKLYSVELK